MQESDTLDENKMVEQIVDAEKAQMVERVKHRGIRGGTIGNSAAIRGRNVGPVRKSRGVPVIYRESIRNDAPEGQITMDRILVLPKRGRSEPKNDPIAQERAEAKRNRKARKMMENVEAGGYGQQ